MAIKMTQDGKDNLKKQLEELNCKLLELRQEKLTAYELTGDTWHDNPYFNKLEQDERSLSAQIAEVQNILGDAEIINSSARSIDVVDVGSIIRCHCFYPDDDDSEYMTLEIVGFGETDIFSGKLHCESPVAKSILGHRKGEKVTFDTPAGEAQYTILKFYSSWEEANADEE